MSSVARTVRASEKIRAEIEQTFGFFPPFFEPALPTPQVLENLWQQTLSAYVQSPLSALLKERLNALLSRYCTAPYCMIVHSSALRPLGMTARQVLALLEEPSLDNETALPLGSLCVPLPEEVAAPATDSLLERTLLYCATEVFLERAQAAACQAELRRLLGPDLYPHLITYLAYIKTCHTWVEAHPEVSYEADRRAQDNLGPLMAEEPALADFFRDYQVRVRELGLGRERRRAADETLRAEQARTAGILESISDGFIALDREWRFTYLNDQAERVLFQRRSEVLGRLFWDVFPATVGTIFEANYRRAVDEQVTVAFEEFFAPLDAWFEIRVYPSAGGLSLFFQDITERKRAEAERERLAEREQFLAALAERARSLADPDEVIADAVHSVGKFLGVSRCIFADIDIEADTCTIHASEYRANPAAASIVGVVSIASFGAFVVSEYAARRAVVVDDVRRDSIRAPEGSLAAYEAINIRAHVTVPVVHFERVVSCMSLHSAAPRHWKPEEIELLRAVVERTWLTVEVIRQNRALVREGEATARILASITDAFFALDRQFRFTYVNPQAERVLFRNREALLGQEIWAAFPEGAGSTFDQQYRRAVTEGVPVSFEEFYSPLNTWFEVRAYPSPDGSLSVFFQNVNDRKQAEAERELLRAEQERLLTEQRMRAEREALLNRIGQSLRNFSAPEQILETAVRELGEALEADRCYYTSYDQEIDRATVGPDWHRTGLPSLAGEYVMSRFGVNQDPVYKTGKTQVVAEVQGDAATLSLGLKALVRVPLVSGTSMTALALAMADGPRAWTAEEVSLVEAVTTQTQTALEAALTSRRERTIAQQLQNALQPALPSQISGLSLGSFTRPALDEASVGGDFYDVFPLDKEQYALVIGDVSGKGLAAAQQLALIRNSLRTTLYLYRNPAQAVTNLNAIVSAHDLLVGFVTAWVGVYDVGTGQIRYASCGHEPGLVKRVGGVVDELTTTGPPLGVAQNADYGEMTITLSSGDSLLLYTDGISEAGVNRREMLGTAGLIRILTALPEGGDVQAQAEALVTEVSNYAGGIFRDDVAVLLARRE